VLEPLGIGPRHLADLYDVPPLRILEAQERAARFHGDLGLPFTPVVDHVLLPAHPQDAAEAGQTLAVPLITGTNREEMRLFVTLDPKTYALSYGELEGRIASLPGVGADLAPDLAEAYRGRHPGVPAGQVLAAVHTDWAFRIPAIRHAEAQAASGLPAWMYWFTFATPAFGGVFGSCHGLEIPFVFDVIDRPGVEMFTGSDPARRHLADAMVTAWLSFARTGDPGWPTYEAGAGRTTERFDVDSETVDDPEPDLRDLWKDVVRR
jgi:carboxylesterase type B